MQRYTGNNLNSGSQRFYEGDFGRPARSLPKIPESLKDANNDIIDGRQKGWKKVLEAIATILGWVYIIVYLVFVVYGIIAENFNLPRFYFWIYTQEMLDETKEIFYIWFVAILSIFLIIFLWKEYNLRVLAPRNKREMPSDTTDEDLAEIFKTDVATIQKIKDECNKNRYYEFPDRFI